MICKDKNLIKKRFQMTVKSNNDNACLDISIHIFLVLSAFPYMLKHNSLITKISPYFVMIKNVRKKLQNVRAERKVADALNQRDILELI